MSARVNPFFTPTQISGCALWLDGADPNALILSGVSVSQWRDKSGNGWNFVQQGSFALPSPLTRAVGGNSAVSFTGNSTQNDSANQILTNASFPLNSSSSGYSIFVVSRQNATRPSYTGYNYILSAYAGGAGTGLFYGTEPGGNLLTANGTAGPSSGFNDLTANVPNTAMTPLTQTSIIVSGSVLTPYLNATAMTPKTGTCIALTGISVGNAYAPGQTFTGQTWGGIICEILIYNSAVSTVQRQQVEGYLAWKWGLQGNLPANHPYKTSIIPPLLNPPVSLPAAAQNSQSTFSPTQISGCQLWLDAADQSTLTLSGSSVSSWRDKSGNGYTATGTVAPTYNASTRYVVFNGSSQYCTVSAGAYPTGNNPYSIFIVAYTNNVANPQWIISGGTRSTNQAIGVLFYTTNAVWHSWWANEYSFNNVVSNQTPVLINASYSSLRTTIINGGTTLQNSPGASRSNPNSPNYISSMPDPTGQQLDGGVGEIIIYTSEIPVSQRQQVEGYLAWKWGLQESLPVTHPFKRGPPFTPAVAAPARAIGQTGRFNPLQISGCSCWLDASDSTSFTVSGTAISQWRDKALSRAFNGTGTSATADSFACVRMNGSQGLTSATTFSFSEVCSNAANMICFLVVNVSSSTNVNSSPFSLNFAQPRFIPFYNGSGSVFFDAGNQADPRLSGSFTNNLRQIHVFLRSGITTLQIRINGSLNASSTFSSPANYGNQTYTGYISPSGAGGTYVGDIHEILYYSTEIGLANLQRVEGYLAWKWGLQGSLPANHPWKSYPPPP